MQENINIPDSNITTNLTFRQLVLMNMQQLTNFPYIEKDFDALTDYELLCLVVKFLNDVIANQNEQNDSITRMYESFLALQDYVNNTKDELEDAFNNLDDYVRNYFENLDVQEEINNKLDKMLEDGVLEQIIEQFIQSTAIWGFDTVEDMSDATNLINGSFARTLGYNTVNDGAGGLYKISDTKDSNFEQIELNNGLYANYINESLVVSIENYDGATAEERLFKALDDVTYGVIIAGKVEINNVYNAKAKDYRNITILGATLDIKIDYWFNQALSSYHSVPIFKSCSIKGNGHVMYDNSYNCIGTMFNACDINDLCVYSNENYYVQSLYVIGCTLNNVHNFLTAKQVYDMKITNTRVESASGKLIVLTGNESILQSTISNSLIEGRSDVIIEYVSAFKFVIENCYFESNLQGLINQIGSNKASYVTVDNNVFFGDLTANAEINFETTTSINQAKVTNNLCNLASDKLLCNKNLGAYQTTFISPTNTNYAHPWKNNGFILSGNRYNSINENANVGTWDSSDNTWNYDIIMPFAEYYSWAHPFYVIFAGCFGSGSSNYQGFAILRLTPRVAYSSENNVHNVCDCTIVDSCNSNNVVKTSSVTASVSLSSISPGTTSQTISVKINGFNSTRGQFKVLDMFTILDVITRN